MRDFLAEAQREVDDMLPNTPRISEQESGIGGVIVYAPRRDKFAAVMEYFGAHRNPIDGWFFGDGTCISDAEYCYDKEGACILAKLRQYKQK